MLDLDDDLEVEDLAAEPDGKHCPACGKDIGFMSVAMAPLPHLVKCRHCKTKLRYLDVFNAYVIFGVISFVVGFLTGWIAYSGTVPEESRTLVMIVSISALALVAGSIFVAHLRSSKVLALR